MKYVKPVNYAKMCGVSHQYIYKLIKNGIIQKTIIEGMGEFIDLNLYPIENLKKINKKKIDI